jgi:hypothetical protein
MAVKLASGYIDLTVRYASGMKQITSDFAGLQTTATKSGTQAGKNLSKAMASEVSKGGTQAAQGFFKEFRTPAERIGAATGLVIGKTIGGGIRAGIGTVNIAQALGGRLVSGAASVGRDIGRTISGAVITSLKGLGLGAGLAGAGGLGGILFAGFDRLKAIDNAKFKLQALGNSAADVKQIMDSALKSVQGTAFSFADAADAAAAATAAGVKPGKDLTKYLSDIADLAAVSQRPLGDVASIFNKIQTTNKVYLEDLQQLPSIPIFKWLQQQYGVTADKLSDMVSKGEVDAQHFQAAIEQHISGAALKMGESFSGAVENAKAALARLGAAILDPIFSQGAGGLGGLTEGIDKFTKYINDHRPQVVQFFTDVGVGAVSLAQDCVKSFGEIIKAAGDFSHALGSVVGVFDGEKGAKLQAVGDTLNNIGDKLISTAAGFDSAKDKVRAWGAELKTAAENAQGVNGQITGIGDALGALNPLKKIVVTADTSDADAKISDIAAKLNGLSGTVTAPGAVAPSFLGTPLTGYTGPGASFLNSPNAYWGRQAPGSGGFLTGPLAGNKGFVGPQAPGGGLFGGGASGPSFSGPGSHPGPAQTGGGGNSLPGIAPPLKGNFGAEGWRPTVQSVIAAYGPGLGITNSKAWEDALVRQIQTESGGNPGADNPHDGNGRGGTQHVTGLLQFLPSTFSAHNISGGGYTDPTAQIAAALHYVITRYGVDSSGAPLQIGRGVGYAMGGAARGPGGPKGDKIPALLSDNEHVFTADDVNAMGGQGAVYQFRNMLHRAGGGGISLGNVQFDPEDIPRMPGVQGQYPGEHHGGPGWARRPGHEHIMMPPWWWEGGPNWEGIRPGARQGPDPDLYALHRKGGGSIQWMDLIKQGSSGGDGAFKGPGVGDIGKRITSPLKPRNPEWGDRPHGIIQGPNYSPRGVWDDIGVLAPWWMFPGDPSKQRGGVFGMDPHSPDWTRRRDVMIGPHAPGNNQGGHPPHRQPGAFRPPASGKTPDPNLPLWPPMKGGNKPGERALGRRLGFADGGAVDINQLLAMLVGGTQHGQGQGAAPGPVGPDGHPVDPQAQQQTPDVGRTEGYIPAGAGSSGQAGTSFASGLYGMAASAINALIDQAASAASSAAGMGVNMIAPGAGGAASGAASAAIGLGTQAAKRGVDYGFQMAGIWTDALAEILLPFGVPRLFNTDVTGFMPQFTPVAAAQTTGEKAEAQQEPHEGTGAPPGPGPGGPVQPGQLAGAQPVAPPVQKAQPGGIAPGPAPINPGGPSTPWIKPKTAQPGAPNIAPWDKQILQQGGVNLKQYAKPPAPVAPPVKPPAPVGPKPQPGGGFATDWLKMIGVFDQGGILPPKGLAINNTRRPEPMAVFNHDQWGTLDSLANSNVAEFDPESNGNHYDYSFRPEKVVVQDVNELQRVVTDRQKIQAMRYGGRPSMGQK